MGLEAEKAGWWEAGYFWEVGLIFARSMVVAIVSSCFVDGKGGWVFDKEEAWLENALLIDDCRSSPHDPFRCIQPCTKRSRLLLL